MFIFVEGDEPGLKVDSALSRTVLYRTKERYPKGYLPGSFILKMKRMKYKGAIFDFNGTLFWDTALHNQAWNLFLEQHGFNLSDAEMNMKIHGKTNQDILRGLFQRELDEDEVTRMILEKEGAYQQICRTARLQLAPGVTDMLDHLQQRQVPFTIATASGKENIDFYFDYLPLSKWFDPDKIIYNNGTFRGKPHPDIFLLAAERLGLNASETVIFEDSYHGITAAERAGAGKIVIVNSNGEEYSKYPYLIIRDFYQAIELKMFD